MRPVVGYGGYRCAVAELYCGHCRLFIGATWFHLVPYGSMLPQLPAICQRWHQVTASKMPGKRAMRQTEFDLFRALKRGSLNVVLELRRTFEIALMTSFFLQFPIQNHRMVC